MLLRLLRGEQQARNGLVRVREAEVVALGTEAEVELLEQWVERREYASDVGKRDVS